MAKEEIFITDWWFDPEINLIRDEDTQNSFGMTKVELKDLLIKCVVERGVKVFVLVYGNVESGTVFPLKNLNKFLYGTFFSLLYIFSKILYFIANLISSNNRS